jgi:hypothetical protein
MLTYMGPAQLWFEGSCLFSARLLQTSRCVSQLALPPSFLLLLFRTSNRPAASQHGRGASNRSFASTPWRSNRSGHLPQSASCNLHSSSGDDAYFSNVDGSTESVYQSFRHESFQVCRRVLRPRLRKFCLRSRVSGSTDSVQLHFLALITLGFVFMNVGMGKHAWNLPMHSYSRLAEVHCFILKSTSASRLTMNDSSSTFNKQCTCLLSSSPR